MPPPREARLDVILTADRGSFTDYGGSSVLGYVACMPSRLVPRFFMDRLFTPRVKSDRLGRALIAPYALRKVEAALARAGYRVWAVPPERLASVIRRMGVHVVGISAHDPLGLDPVSYKLSMIFGGGETWTARFFRELGDLVRSLKAEHGFKVVIGGPGAWELINSPPDYMDLLFLGEAEQTLPEVIGKLISGEPLPKIFRVKAGDLRMNDLL